MQRDYLIRVETESMSDFKRLNGLMIGFVIKGEAHIYDENNMTQYNSGDIFIINHRDLYRDFNFNKRASYVISNSK